MKRVTGMFGTASMTGRRPRSTGAITVAEGRRGDRFSTDRPVDDVSPEMMIVGATLGILMIALALYLI